VALAALLVLVCPLRAVAQSPPDLPAQGVAPGTSTGGRHGMGKLRGEPGIPREELQRLLDEGRFGELERAFLHDIERLEGRGGEDSPELAAALKNLGLVYHIQARFDDAMRLYRRALAIRRKVLGDSDPQVALSLSQMAELEQARGRFGEAEHMHKQALAIFRATRPADSLDVGLGANNLARLYIAQKRLDEAEALLVEAQRIFEKARGPVHSDVALASNNLALVARGKGRLDEARRHLWRAADIFRQLGADNPNLAVALNNLASLALEMGDPAEALERAEEAGTIIARRMRRRLYSPSNQDSGPAAMPWNRAAFEMITAAAWRLNEGDTTRPVELADKSFLAVQWISRTRAATALEQMSLRQATGDGALARLIRDRQDLQARWQAYNNSLVASLSSQPGQRDAASEKASRDSAADIDRRLAGIDDRLLVEFPTFADLASAAPMSIGEVQGLLGDDEALILTHSGSAGAPAAAGTFVWVITRTAARWVHSEVGADALARRVAALRCGLDAAAWRGEGGKRCAQLLNLPPEYVPERGNPLPFDASGAYALYIDLLGGVADLIKGKQLLVVPAGALTRLPLQALVTEPPKGAGFNSVKWLARDHAVTILPAVSSLKALRRVARPTSARRVMIGFGNPLLDGPQSDPEDGAYFKEQAAIARGRTGCADARPLRTATLRGLGLGVVAMPQTDGLADGAQLRAAPPLPETADELCAVARDLKADVADIRVGASATEREVKRLSGSSELADFRIVHFATHGTLAGELRGTAEPGLILTPPVVATTGDDGYLSASEIASLRLDADWVILSACNTAGPAGAAPGEGEAAGEVAEALSGLARAFFYAGARALLVSHWAVDSGATVKLITSTAGQTARDPKLGRAEALRRAMLSLIDHGKPREAHPSYWAPFVLVGEGGAGR
jgi:CHAT domain-containing protein/tetratricopeptide (TPR) repeat protein